MQSLIDVDLPLSKFKEVAVPTGVCLPFAGTVAPPGWLLCDGATYNVRNYEKLYQAIGRTFTSGGGSDTFQVPDLRGRTAIGAGQGGGLTDRTLGGSGGEENHVLAAGELAAHPHPVSDPGHGHTVSDPGHTHNVNDSGHVHSVPVGSYTIYLASGANSYGPTYNGQGPTNSNSATTGVTVQSDTTGATVDSNTTGLTVGNNTPSGNGHNTMQPFLVLNFIIKT